MARSFLGRRVWREYRHARSKHAQVHPTGLSARNPGLIHDQQPGHTVEGRRSIARWCGEAARFISGDPNRSPRRPRAKSVWIAGTFVIARELRFTSDAPRNAASRLELRRIRGIHIIQRIAKRSAAREFAYSRKMRSGRYATFVRRWNVRGRVCHLPAGVPCSPVTLR